MNRLVTTGAIGLLACLTSLTAYAADALIVASTDAIQDAALQSLTQQDFAIIDDAQTDNFSLIYAATADGAHMSVAIRRLSEEEDRHRVIVASDSPHNPNTEQTLLQALQNIIRQQ